MPNKRTGSAATVDPVTAFATPIIAELRERAADRDAEGASTAPVYRRVADELEARRIAFLNAELSIDQAARESGYSAVQLRRLKRDGEWSGCRADLPRRPRPELATRNRGGRTLAEQAIEARSRRRQ